MRCPAGGLALLVGLPSPPRERSWRQEEDVGREESITGELPARCPNEEEPLRGGSLETADALDTQARSTGVSSSPSKAIPPSTLPFFPLNSHSTRICCGPIMCRAPLT